VRLDGDQMAADADDGDAGHVSRTYMRCFEPLGRRERSEARCTVPALPPTTAEREGCAMRCQPGGRLNSRIDVADLRAPGCPPPRLHR
jgi:hypothetical protein